MIEYDGRLGEIIARRRCLTTVIFGGAPIRPARSKFRLPVITMRINRDELGR